jgi:hypothetical protein
MGTAHESHQIRRRKKNSSVKISHWLPISSEIQPMTERLSFKAASLSQPWVSSLFGGLDGSILNFTLGTAP